MTLFPGGRRQSSADAIEQEATGLGQIKISAGFSNHR